MAKSPIDQFKEIDAQRTSLQFKRKPTNAKHHFFIYSPHGRWEFILSEYYARISSCTYRQYWHSMREHQSYSSVLLDCSFPHLTPRAIAVPCYSICMSHVQKLVFIQARIPAHGGAGFN